MKTENSALIDRAKALQEELHGLRGDLKTVEQERTALVKEKRKLQSDSDAAAMQRGLLWNDLQAAKEMAQALEVEKTKLRSEGLIRQARVNELEYASSADREAVDWLEEQIAALTQEGGDESQETASLRAEHDMLQTRLHDTEQANSAQNDILAELREDKHALALRLEEQSQAINALRLSWQSLGTRLKQAQQTQQQTIATYTAQDNTLSKEMQQLGTQLSDSQHQQNLARSDANQLQFDNEALLRQIQQLQFRLDARQHETPTEREARLLRTETADIEQLHASI